MIIIRSGLELQRRKRVCRQKNQLKTIGHSEIQVKKIVWYAERKTEGKHLRCIYHDSRDVLPPEWESEGIIILILEDAEKFDPAGVAANLD